jgi:hypothetical protein
MSKVDAIFYAMLRVAPKESTVTMDMARAALAATELSDETTLLLTVARLLRARLPDMAPAYQEGDTEALNKALAPFEDI